MTTSTPEVHLHFCMGSRDYDLTTGEPSCYILTLSFYKRIYTMNSIGDICFTSVPLGDVMPDYNWTFYVASQRPRTEQIYDAMVCFMEGVLKNCSKYVTLESLVTAMETGTYPASVMEILKGHVRELNTYVDPPIVAPQSSVTFPELDLNAMYEEIVQQRKEREEAEKAEKFAHALQAYHAGIEAGRRAGKG